MKGEDEDGGGISSPRPERKLCGGQLTLGANEGVGGMMTLEPPHPRCKRADKGLLPSHFPPVRHLPTLSITRSRVG